MRLLRRLTPGVLFLLVEACFPSTRPASITPETPIAASSWLKVGLGGERQTVRLNSANPIIISDPLSGIITILAPNDSLRVDWADGRVLLRQVRLGNLSGRTFLLEAGGDHRMNLDGRSYRGVIEVRAADAGIQMINRLPLEQYLVGVVSAELGARDTVVFEALKAQAVAARTYAVGNRGRWGTRGFDLLDDVSDQVFPGDDGATALADAAVNATRGEILTYGGKPIEIFYSSTCGGHTEAVDEVFGTGSRPWLRGVSDLAPDGTAWCAGSPSFQWQEQWSGSGLARILEAATTRKGLPIGRIGDLTDIQVVERSASGRARVVELQGQYGRTTIRGQEVRRILAPERGGLLRSNQFRIVVGREGGKVVNLTLNGNGNGHGVGLCQWGSLGRARAGQDYLTILTSYFPGVNLSRISGEGVMVWQIR